MPTPSGSSPLQIDRRQADVRGISAACQQATFAAVTWQGTIDPLLTSCLSSSLPQSGHLPELAMKIVGSNSGSWLRVNRLDDASGHYFGYDAEVRVEITHGSFQGRNRDLQFMNLPVFVAELERFITNRHLFPRLEGTYDSFIQFCSVGSQVHVEFSIGDAYCGSKIHEFKVRGGFEINQDYLSDMLRGWKELMATG